MESKCKEHFVAYIDLLGFSDSSISADNIITENILELLTSLAALRNEFTIKTEKQNDRKTIDITPAISTFSDHIVISYPLEKTKSAVGEKGLGGIFVILSDFMKLLVRIAAASLRNGFLIRGGAAIGNLYHAGEVVFGEALVDAYRTESTISCYPRVVLSNTITKRQDWMKLGHDLLRGNDGLYYFNYYHLLAVAPILPSKDFKKETEEWFDRIVETINTNIIDLDRRGKQAELAKWIWFGKEFQKRTDRDLLKQFNLSFKKTIWSR